MTRKNNDMTLFRQIVSSLRPRRIAIWALKSPTNNTLVSLRVLVIVAVCGGLEWAGRLFIMSLIWPFKYFTIKRVIFATIFFAAGVGAVGVGLMGVSNLQCVETAISKVERCYLVFPIDPVMKKYIK